MGAGQNDKWRTLFTKVIDENTKAGSSTMAFIDALHFYRGGEARERNVAAQLNRASGLNLVIAMIAVWNTVYLARPWTPCAQRGRR